MNSHCSKPVRTEYKNTVFRSKSEAVFARALDLSPFGLSWSYEPEVHTSHKWDFEVHRPRYGYCDKCGSRCFDRFDLLLLEFKPAEPTRQYTANLTEKVRRFPGTHKSTVFSSYVVWGNPWSGPVGISDCSWIMYPIFARHAEYGFGDFDQSADNGEPYLYSSRHQIGDILGITEDIAQQARRFRFDLKVDAYDGV